MIFLLLSHPKMPLCYNIMLLINVLLAIHSHCRLSFFDGSTAAIYFPSYTWIFILVSPPSCISIFLAVFHRCLLLSILVKRPVIYPLCLGQRNPNTRINIVPSIILEQWFPTFGTYLILQKTAIECRASDY